VDEVEDPIREYEASAESLPPGGRLRPGHDLAGGVAGRADQYLPSARGAKCKVRTNPGSSTCSAY
jgi:hypothetical protein